MVVIEQNIPSLKGIHILAAEDSVDIQFLLKHYLKNAEAQMDVVSNGLQALEALKQRSYDVVLMDIQMPEMDGVEAVRHIRAHGWTGPIIALTAHAHQSERMRVLSSGFNEYLVKPFKKVELIETIFGIYNKFKSSS